MNMTIKALLDEVRTAFETLGYDLRTHNFSIVIRPTLTQSQCEVRLDGKYFGVWDTARKTFVD